MAKYALNCYWNPHWMEKISSPTFRPLEHTLFVSEDGTWRETQLPGIVPQSGGFQVGDTIYFAFMMAGGNYGPKKRELHRVKISFRKRGGFGDGQHNPIGIANGSGSTDGQIWSVQCDDFQIENEHTAEYAQLFQAPNTQGDTVSTFEFTDDDDSSWVVGVKALYKPGTPNEREFAFDPEWVVGSGGPAPELPTG